MYSFTPAGFEAISFLFNDGTSQVIGNVQVTGSASETITFAAGEVVTGLQVISAQVHMAPGHPGYPSFGGFIVSTSAGQSVTFQPDTPAVVTTVQEYGDGHATPNTEFLGGGYLCGMYGWTMGSWEVMTGIDTVGQNAGVENEGVNGALSYDSDIQRTYGLRDLGYAYSGGSW